MCIRDRIEPHVERFIAPKAEAPSASVEMKGGDPEVVEHASHAPLHALKPFPHVREIVVYHRQSCLLYTSDAADDLLCVDLGGRRIIKKKKKTQKHTKNDTQRPT